MAGNVGIIGRARVGKDTAGEWFVRERGYKRVSFADPLKEAALRLNPIVEVFGGVAGGFDEFRLSQVVTADGWEEAKTNPEVRRTLQELGMAIRAIDEEFWLRTALKRVQEVNESGFAAVVTDVRFPNEAASLRRAGFELLYIDRPGVLHLTHESEGALTDADADLVLTNGGTLADFLTDVEHVANLITVPRRYAIGIDN